MKFQILGPMTGKNSCENKLGGGMHSRSDSLALSCDSVWLHKYQTSAIEYARIQAIVKLKKTVKIYSKTDNKISMSWSFQLELYDVS